MQFDINLILVPITLIFLLIWLVDKVHLKRHRLVLVHQKAIYASEQQLKQKQKALQSVMAAHAITDDPTHFLPTEATALDVRSAHGEYVAASTHHNALKNQGVSEPVLVNWAYDFLPILLAIVILRAFVGEIFNIPSSSMVPTLYTGDYILVNKWAYGLRLPLIHTKILDTGRPLHGDVVVFRYPNNEKLYYIKRVVGLPGDTVAFMNGTLSVNGTPVATSPSNVGMDKNFLGNLYPKIVSGQTLGNAERLSLATEEEKYARYYQETLGIHRYQVRYLGDLNVSRYAPFLQANSPELAASRGASWKIVIPEGSYFMMGDNRDRSEDGRFWGLVSDNQLSGRATHILFHKNPGLALPSFGRTGKID